MARRRQRIAGDRERRAMVKNLAEILDSERLLWYDNKRCRKQKPSVSHPPPQVAVGRSDRKIAPLWLLSLF
ncbi:MAG: hypothetical protein UC390_10635 [Peptococcaceae bacterium]|nr:hypothetical protein [Peptococcaceae bacterium]